jgi:ketosteroid isomerase-like protein
VLEQATRAALYNLYEAYERRDVARIADLIDDEIDWVIYGPVAILPFEGARRGKSEVMATLCAISNELDLTRCVPEVVLVDGERAAAICEVAFKQRTTGRMLRLRLADFLRFRDGRLIEFREFSDTFDAVEQMLGRSIAV